MLQPINESLETTLKRIKSNRILLPDFQRQFVWKEEESQRKLIASVLTKMPIGSILLLKSNNASDYACKPLGSKDPLPVEDLPVGQVEFLLDGQQRMTVLANVFSDVIFQLSTRVTSLVAPTALKRRFFLALPRYDKYAPDLFGLHSLSFPMNTPESDDPSFLTADILPYIRVIPFAASSKDKDKCYNPYNPTTMAKKLSGLATFCPQAEAGWYYIPLFLLIDTSTSNMNAPNLTKIIRSIADDIRQIKVDTLRESIENDASFDVGSYVKKHLSTGCYESYIDPSCLNGSTDELIEQFADALVVMSDDWSTKMIAYLRSCLSQINLSQISLEDSQRARAIDIYENLNRGGVSLDIFDLLMARVAQVTTVPFYTRLSNCISSGSNYPVLNIESQTVKKHFLPLATAGTYHASSRMECYSEERNEFSKAYLEAFLNVLVMLCNSTHLQPGDYTPDLIKRQKKLALKAWEINDNCERSCDALDRAFFFFQTRCGIRNIREINYTLMIPIVGFILADDDCYRGNISGQVFNLLEAWYWSSVFSGAYDRDQNQIMMNDLNWLLSVITALKNNYTPNTTYVKKRRDNVLMQRGFSDCDFLLLTSPDTDDYPKGVISSGICQYFLSQGYVDLIAEDADQDQLLSVFCPASRTLEVHHVIPLGASSIQQSTKDIRSNRKHYLNSPLNHMYISEKANQLISCKSLAEYSSMLPANAGLSNVGFQNVNITAASSDDAKKEVLRQRHNSLRQAITLRITGYYRNTTE